MKRGSAGQYKTPSVAGEAIRAFIPNPLPPEPALVLGDQRQSRSDPRQTPTSYRGSGNLHQFHIKEQRMPGQWVIRIKGDALAVESGDVHI